MAACATMLGCGPSDAPKSERSPEEAAARLSASQRAVRLTEESGRLEQEGKLDEAIAKASEAIALTPGLAAAYEARGIAYAAKKEYVRAQADLEIASKILPLNGRIHFRRGQIYLETGEPTSAHTQLTQAMNKGYINPLVLLGLGDANAAGKRYADAREYYDRAIKSDPRLARAYLHRGRLSLQLGFAAEAKDDFAKARQLNLEVDDAGKTPAEKKP